MSKRVEFPVETINGEVKYEIYSHNISHLEGQLLTQIDASISDSVNRQALKDIFRQTVWEWAFNCIPKSSGSDVPSLPIKQ